MEEEEDKYMKACVPTIGLDGLNDMVAQHFGRAPTYTVVDIETNKVEIIANTGRHAGGEKLSPELIAETGANVMLCSGLGPKAVRMFEEFGIDVFVGASGTVQDAIALWKKGSLEEATNENACREHRQH